MMALPHLSLMRRTVNEVADEFRPDIVHSYYVWPAGLVGQLCSSRLGVPHVISCRGADLTEEGLECPGRVHQFLRRADCVTTVASSLGDWVRVMAGVENSVFVPNSICPNYFERAAYPKTEMRRDYGLPTAATVVGAIHSFRWKKAPDYLIELVTEIGRSDLPDVVFVLAGLYEGEFADELRRRFEGTGSAKRERRVLVFSKLDRSELPRVLSALDLFILPSRHEGMSNVMLESLASGTPVAATDVDGATDVLKDQTAGLLLDRFDPLVASRQVGELLADPARLARMAAACRPLIESNYLLEHEVGTLRTLYQGLIEARAGRGASDVSESLRNRSSRTDLQVPL